jgi:carbon-monoxide dehydrogenase iron sulfur subunit
MGRSDGKMKRVYAREEVCMGCGLCEVHCAVQHSASRDIVKAFKRERPRATSRVRVERQGHISFALQCRHCPEPLCAYSCLTGALSKRGPIVEHDESRCIGCWTCVAVCPYGALKVDLSAGKVQGKCDLCPGLDTPACVNNCPNEALVYE